MLFKQGGEIVHAAKGEHVRDLGNGPLSLLQQILSVGELFLCDVFHQPQAGIFLKQGGQVAGVYRDALGDIRYGDFLMDIFSNVGAHPLDNIQLHGVLYPRLSPAPEVMLHFPGADQHDHNFLNQAQDIVCKVQALVFLFLEQAEKEAAQLTVAADFITGKQLRFPILHIEAHQSAAAGRGAEKEKDCPGSSKRTSSR